MIDRSLRIFIAGRSTMRLSIREMIAKLPNHAHSGYDWTVDPGWDNPARYSPHSVAARDLAEVELSDGLIWVLDGHPSHGAPYEVGYADRGGQPVVVLWTNSAPLSPSLLYAFRHPVAHTLAEAVASLERQVLANEKRHPVFSEAVIESQEPELDLLTLVSLQQIAKALRICNGEPE